MSLRLRILFILLMCCCTALLHSACNDDFTPKPKAYPKIELPARTGYQTFHAHNYPYTFSYPDYATWERDSSEMPDVRDKDAFWINLRFPSLNATLHITYKSLRTHALDRLIYEAFKLTNKQVYKATHIDKKQLRTRYGYDAVMFNVAGDAATAHQFFVTDGKRHFLRGALYINSTPNEDSLKIVTDFLYKDLDTLVQTLHFSR